jgi:hypothetical protein
VNCAISEEQELMKLNGTARVFFQRLAPLPHRLTHNLKPMTRSIPQAQAATLVSRLNFIPMIYPRKVS